MPKNAPHVALDRPVVAIDIAKSVFQVYALGPDHRPKQKTLRRAQVLRHFSKLPPSIVVMEACGGAHFWARSLQAQGHQLKLLPAMRVKPFLLGDKTDANDAAAIFVAAHQPQIKSVAVKTEAQQALNGLHRLRSQLLKLRIMQTNGLRAILYEFGMVLPEGYNHLMKQLPAALAKAALGLPKVLIDSLKEQWERIERLQADMDELTDRIKTSARENPQSKRLLAIPGVGPLTATAICGVDVAAFTSGRSFGAWLGLTPSKSGTGGKIVQGAISKKGDVYLRTLLMQGARSVISTGASHSAWLVALTTRRPRNVAIAALANKMARTIWAMLQKEAVFDRAHWGLAVVA